MLFDGIKAVLAGELKQVYYTHRPTKWMTCQLFFEKNQITLKVLHFELNRDHTFAYIDRKMKCIVTLTPMLRVRTFDGTKDGSYSFVREYSYNAEFIQRNFDKSNIGVSGEEMVKYILRHYGYDDRDLYRAMVPWGKMIPWEENPKWKRHWRNADIGDVLKPLRVPATKTMKKVILERIGNSEILPLLSSIKFLWELCPDPNVFINVWPVLDFTIPAFWDLKESKPAFLDMVGRWNKRQKINFVKSLGELHRSDVRWWQDTLDMADRLYEKLGEVNVRGTNLRQLHDNLAIETKKLELVEGHKPIVYSEYFQKVHGAKFEVGDEEHKIIIPYNGHEILQWSIELHNCMDTYAERAMRGSIVLMGVKNSKGELVVGLEINYGRIWQMVTYNNNSVTPEMSKAVNKVLREFDIIKDEKGKINRPIEDVDVF